MNPEERFDTTRRIMPTATGSAAIFGLAGCVGGDDDNDTGGTDEDDADPNGETGEEPDEAGVTLLVEGVGGEHDHTDDQTDGEHQDDTEGGHDEQDYPHDGLTHDEIDHACGPLEFDDPGNIDATDGMEDAPVIDVVHEPYSVSIDGESGYVKFELPEGNHEGEHEDNDEDDRQNEADEDYDEEESHSEDGGEMVGLFTIAGHVEEIHTGELLYQHESDVEDCDPMDRYTVVELDHGKVVVEPVSGL